VTLDFYVRLSSDAAIFRRLVHLRDSQHLVLNVLYICRIISDGKKDYGAFSWYEIFSSVHRLCECMGRYVFITGVIPVQHKQNLSCNKHSATRANNRPTHLSTQQLMRNNWRIVILRVPKKIFWLSIYQQRLMTDGQTAPRRWNQLPTGLKLCQSTVLFKRKLNTFFLPRDAMLVRYMRSLCLSVCHKSVFYWNS